MRGQLKALWMEFKWLTAGAYPSFVTQAHPLPLDYASVPVFMFHSVTAKRFESQVRFLAHNRYATLGADEFHAFLTKQAPLPGRAVMLSFDDGEQSWLRVAVPILKQYGLRAVGFVTPGCIGEHRAKDVSGKQWLTWNELSDIQASGTFDLQSHTLYHERMFVGNRVAGYVRPELFTDALETDRPRVMCHGATDRLRDLGSPVYAMESRMGNRLKFLDNEDVRAACIEFVKANGGTAFFQAPGWKRRIENVYLAAVRKHGPGRFETVDEQIAAIQTSLAEARRILEERLNKPVTDIAYPWGIGGELATRLSRETGYRTNYRIPNIGCRINHPGQDPYRIVRLKDDYIFRLPGENRLPLFEIFRHKFDRRRTQSDIY